MLTQFIRKTMGPNIMKYNFAQATANRDYYNLLGV